MSIRWLQAAWDCRTGKAYDWKGTRSDGRSFRILYFKHTGYLCSTFNGQKLGKGKTLAEAQKLAEDCPAVKVRLPVAA